MTSSSSWEKAIIIPTRFPNRGIDEYHHRDDGDWPQTMANRQEKFFCLNE